MLGDQDTGFLKNWTILCLKFVVHSLFECENGGIIITVLVN